MITELEARPRSAPSVPKTGCSRSMSAARLDARRRQGPLDEFVGRLTRMVAAFATEQQLEQAEVCVELVDGSRHTLETTSAEPGFGFFSFTPHRDDRRRAAEVDRPDRCCPVDRDLGAGSRAAVRLRSDRVARLAAVLQLAPGRNGRELEERASALRAPRSRSRPCRRSTRRRGGLPSRGGRATRRGTRACAAGRRATRRSAARRAPVTDEVEPEPAAAHPRCGRRRRARRGPRTPARRASLVAISSMRTAAAMTRSSKSCAENSNRVPEELDDEVVPGAVVGREHRGQGI